MPGVKHFSMFYCSTTVISVILESLDERVETISVFNIGEGLDAQGPETGNLRVPLFASR